MQRSARTGSHETHADPALPQLPTAFGVQVGPEQHPDGQVEALHPKHTPASQPEAPQLWQGAPPLPHAALVPPVWQTFPAQQPVGHEVGLQTHAPPWHS